MSDAFLKKGIPAILERYELKYTIPYDLIEPISNFVSTYCSLDKYSETSPDFFYEVNSLYFDSPNFTLLQNRIIGIENRFNMRIRSYGNGTQPPYFLEIKQKIGDISRKYRAHIKENISPKVTTRGFYNNMVLKEEDQKNIDLFLQLHNSYNAEPKVLTSYRRKAYISDYDVYARVTFDKELTYVEEHSINLSPPRDKMNYYDNEDIFDENCSVVLELKCLKNYVPQWMLDLITTFDLKRRGFSKYANSLQDMFDGLPPLS